MDVQLVGNMTLKQQRNWLLAAAAVMAAGAAAIIVAAVVTPLDAGAGGTQYSKKPQASTSPAGKIDVLSSYAVIYGRDIRKPIYDVEAPKVEAAKPPPLTVTLKGTVLEPDFTFAIFRNKAGEEKLLKVGDAIEGAEVTAIAEGEATVRYHDQTVTLKAQTKEGS
jgi:hypothetical protein